MFIKPDKWTAFYLSLVLPGAGHVAARSWWAIPWIGAGVACAAIIATSAAPAAENFSLAAAPVLAMAIVGLISGEHAKRLVEEHNSRSTCLARRVTCAPASGRRIDVLMELAFNRPADELWRIAADLSRFLTIDPFHDRVVLMDREPNQGTDLVLSHNAFGRRFLRFGRILRWDPGRGYTFSDLSGQRPRAGFPHVFIVRVDEGPGHDGPVAGSRLTIRVRGRWTSSLVPVLVGRWWVAWVCREHARLLAKAL